MWNLKSPQWIAVTSFFWTSAVLVGFQALQADTSGSAPEIKEFLKYSRSFLVTREIVGSANSATYLVAGRMTEKQPESDSTPYCEFKISSTAQWGAHRLPTGSIFKLASSQRSVVFGSYSIAAQLNVVPTQQQSALNSLSLVVKCTQGGNEFTTPDFLGMLKPYLSVVQPVAPITGRILPQGGIKEILSDLLVERSSMELKAPISPITDSNAANNVVYFQDGQSVRSVDSARASCELVIQSDSGAPATIAAKELIWAEKVYRATSYSGAYEVSMILGREGSKNRSLLTCRPASSEARILELVDVKAILGGGIHWDYPLSSGEGTAQPGAIGTNSIGTTPNGVIPGAAGIPGGVIDSSAPTSDAPGEEAPPETPRDEASPRPSDAPSNPSNPSGPSDGSNGSSSSSPASPSSPANPASPSNTGDPASGGTTPSSPAPGSVIPGPDEKAPVLPPPRLDDTPPSKPGKAGVPAKPIRPKRPPRVPVKQELTDVIREGRIFYTRDLIPIYPMSVGGRYEAAITFAGETLRSPGGNAQACSIRVFPENGTLQVTPLISTYEDDPSTTWAIQPEQKIVVREIEDATLARKSVINVELKSSTGETVVIICPSSGRIAENLTRHELDQMIGEFFEIRERQANPRVLADRPMAVGSKWNVQHSLHLDLDSKNSEYVAYVAEEGLIRFYSNLGYTPACKIRLPKDSKAAITRANDDFEHDRYLAPKQTLTLTRVFDGRLDNTPVVNLVFTTPGNDKVEIGCALPAQFKAKNLRWSQIEKYLSHHLAPADAQAAQTTKPVVQPATPAPAKPQVPQTKPKPAPAAKNPKKLPGGYVVFPVTELKVTPTRTGAAQYGKNGWDLFVNGTFYSKGSQASVGKIIRDGQPEVEGDGKTRNRGAVAIMDDGLIRVCQQAEDIQAACGTGDGDIQDLMGGGGLLILDGEKVGHDNLAFLQRFDQGGLGLRARQFNYSSHTVVATMAGRGYVILALGKTGAQIQNDLFSAGYDGAVKFDGGSGFFARARGQSWGGGPNPTALLGKIRK